MPSDRATFQKNVVRTSKCNSGLKNESQEEIIAAKCHDIVKATRMSLIYSDAGRCRSRDSGSEGVV